MNQEAIDLLENLERPQPNELVPEGWLIENIYSKTDQALDLLKQQPPAGELRKEINSFFAEMNMDNPTWPEALENVKQIVKYLKETLDRLDRAEEINKELLAACKVGASYIDAIECKVPRPITELQEDKELVEAAIAKAEE